MKSYLLLIPEETKNKNAFLWLFNTAIRALNVKQVSVADTAKNGYATITLSLSDSILSTPELFSELEHTTFKFNTEGIILNESGREDELFTAFYLINCLQEYHAKNRDAIGRFEYKGSYQQRFEKIEINFVTELFARYFQKNAPQILENRVFESSKFFFSHDIDSLYGAFLQDGLAALKKGRFDVIARVVFNAALLKPDWFNIDRILKIENEYDLKSTFFWIVNKGRVSKTLTNADYDIHSGPLQQTLKWVENNGSFIGLHKSISDQSFNEEIKELQRKIIINRNHYLRFDLPSHFEKVESSDLKMDCSLGFAEHYGFRNNLAIPFIPYNIKADKPYHFLEIPLNIMDGTFQKYMQLSPVESTSRIINFIEKNSTNAVLSVLWHNHFFSSFRFRGYFEPYKDLLIYLKEKEFKFITPDELYQDYFQPRTI